MGLSDGRKSCPICLAVLIQYRSVTASQPPSQLASHVAVAITLNAKASSLKTVCCRSKYHFHWTAPLHPLYPLVPKVRGTLTPPHPPVAPPMHGTAKQSSRPASCTSQNGAEWVQWFTPGRSTIDQIVTLNTVIQSRKKFQKPVWIAFVDLKAAFDSVDH